MEKCEFADDGSCKVHKTDWSDCYAREKVREAIRPAMDTLGNILTLPNFQTYYGSDFMEHITEVLNELKRMAGVEEK